MRTQRIDTNDTQRETRSAAHRGRAPGHDGVGGGGGRDNVPRRRPSSTRSSARSDFITRHAANVSCSAGLSTTLVRDASVLAT